MESRYLHLFRERLSEIGFPEDITDQMEHFTEQPGVLLPLRHRAKYDGNVVNYTIFALRKPDDWKLQYEVARVDVSLRRPVEIPALVVHGIDVWALDGRMAAQDWTDESRFTEQHRELLKELWKLSENAHPDGVEMREMLVLKHLSDTAFGEHLPQIEAIRARHEIQHSFNVPGQIAFSAMQMYNLLAGRPVAVDVPDEFGQQVTKWIGRDNSIQELSGGPVLTIYESSVNFDVKAALLRTRYAEFLSDQEVVDAVESFRQGNSTLIGASMVGRDDEVFLVAEPWNDRVREDYGLMKALGKAAEESIEGRIAHQPADKEELIANLEKILVASGFVNFSRTHVRSAIFYGDNEFELKCDLFYGPDKLRCRIEIEYRGGFEEYDVRSVYAALTKQIKLPAETPSGTDMEEIERRLSEINWEQGDFIDSRASRLRRLDTVERGVQIMVDDLLEYLSAESFMLPDGVTLKEKLLYKYWIDTPNAKHIPNLERVRRALTYEGRFDQFSFMHVDADRIYQLLNGQVVSRNFAEDETIRRAYLVMHEIGNSRFVQWLPGPTEDLLVKLLEDRVPGFRESADREEVLKDLLVGKEVWVAETRGEERNFRLRLVKDDWRISLSVFPKHDRFSAESYVRLGKLADRLRIMGFGGSSNLVFKMFDNGIEKFAIEKNLEMGDRAKIKANIEFSAASGNYILSSVEIAIVKEINIPTVQNDWTEDLEADMRMIDWSKEDYYQWGNDFHDVTPAGNLTSYMEAGETLQLLEQLYESDNPSDKWKAEALISKYLLLTPNETFGFDKDPFRNRFLVEFTFDQEDLLRLDMIAMYNLVDGRAVYTGRKNDGTEEWYKIDFVDSKPILRAVSSTNSEKILAEIGLLEAPEGFDAQWVIESFRHGDAIDIHVAVDGQVRRIPIFFDVSAEKLVIEADRSAADIGPFLSSHPNWVQRSNWRDIGQVRDFSVHPAPIDQKALQSVMDQLNTWGFDKTAESEVKLALQVGYPEFALTLRKDFGDAVADVVFAFRPTGRLEPSLVSYDFTLTAPDGRRISFEVGGEGSPLMTLNLAKNVAMGRPVLLSADDLSGHWFAIGTIPVGGNGRVKLKEVAFQQSELIRQIDKMPIKNINSKETRSQIYVFLMKGDPAPVTWMREGKEIPGVLIMDPQDRRVKVQFNDGGQSLGPVRRPGEEEGRGNGRGVR